jgi:alpha-tubulin suppressor-like RCC1 family protein
MNVEIFRVSSLFLHDKVIDVFIVLATTTPTTPPPPPPTTTTTTPPTPTTAPPTTTTTPEPLALSYSSPAIFSTALPGQTVEPTVSGGSGSRSFSIEGSLPDDVTFDEATGVFTGPDNWAFEARQIEAGDDHTCALTTSGGVKCWGSNSAGQLGDGTTTSSPTPVNVAGLTSGVASISAGGTHTCAVTNTSGVACWGWNGFGQLGNSSTTSSPTPVNVAGLTSFVTSISAGATHTCAITLTPDHVNVATCWGNNGSGQLGDTTTTNSPTPVNVAGLTSGVASISAGSNHTCAVTYSGSASCWGNNDSGQLGDTTTTNKSAPVNVSGLTTGVASITTGSNHTCATTTSGSARCWGWNAFGQLGDNTTTSRSAPVDVSGLTTGVASITTSTNHTCATTTSGSARCWGWNAFEQLGDNTTTSRSAPVNVSGLTTGVASITTSTSHTCALTTSGNARCWGRNGAGRLGDGTTTNRSTPVNVTGTTGTIDSVSTGIDHTCALTTSGGVKCWGDNFAGRIGDGTTTNRSTPVNVTGLTSGVASISTGNGHNCALTTSGGVTCWGWNGNGGLGNNSFVNSSSPVDVTGLTSGVASISSGNFHTCALTTSGGVTCWGRNEYGQLGDGTTVSKATPVDVTGLTSGVTAISAGGSHTCAVTASGGVKCWGYHGQAILGDGTTNTHSPTPVDVRVAPGGAALSGVASISASSFHTCAVMSSGGAKCWGTGGLGRLGDGTNTSRSTPVDVRVAPGGAALSGVASISAGANHSCALTTSGHVKCWGWNGDGGLGDGTDTDHFSPVDVRVALDDTALSSIASISAGGFRTCAVTTSGRARCWGRNDRGQLGDSTTINRYSPTNVTTWPATITVTVTDGTSSTLTTVQLTQN